MGSKPTEAKRKFRFYERV